MSAVPAVQKVYVGLADGDVSRSRVCVKLLVPLLQKLVLNTLCSTGNLNLSRTSPYNCYSIVWLTAQWLAAHMLA